MPARVPAAPCRIVTRLLRSTARPRRPDSPERSRPGAGAASRGAGRCGAAALAAALVLVAAACSNSASGDGLADLDTADDGAAGVQGDADVGAGASAIDDPIVISAEPPSAPAWLDPSADPRTPQGRQRAQVLPLWVDDLDAAFPPDVCGSAWELDAVAAPASGVDISHYGDVTDMAALGVMRYEHLVRGALAAPTHLAQLCVAVAAVDQARDDALAELAPLIVAASPAAGTGTDSTGADAADTDSADPDAAGDAPESDGALDRSAGDGETAGRRPAGSFPHEVTVVAASPSAALATACIPGADEASLQAYELLVSRGVEDEVEDISYRVARVTKRPAADCTEAPAWTAEWVQQAQEWSDQGQLWVVLGHEASADVSADALCERASAGEPVECPHDWPSPVGWQAAGTIGSR